MRPNACKLAALALAWLVAGSAHAFMDITVAKTERNRQTGDAPPALRISDVYISISASGANGVTLTGPGGAPAVGSYDGGGSYGFYFEGAADRAALDTMLPAGEYSVQVTGGVHDGQVNTFTIGPDWWPAVPQFTQATMNALSGPVDPTQDLVIAWLPFEPAASAPQPRLSLYGGPLFERTLPLSMTSIVIPGGTLEPGNDSFTLYFVNSREQFDSSVPGGLIRTIDVASATTVQFTVAAIPEPSTWAMLGAGVVLLAVGTRARRS
jgi:hypothetical protein